MLRRQIAITLLMLAGCGPGGGGGAPHVTPARTLGPGLEEQLASELFVVSVTPQERAELNSPLTIVFNKPLRPLAEDAPLPAIAVEPAPSGATWQWNGTSAVTLASAGAL